MSNGQKQIGLFVVMVGALIGLAAIDIEAYKLILFWVGSWQVGSWTGNYGRARWPT